MTLHNANECTHRGYKHELHNSYIIMAYVGYDDDDDDDDKYDDDNDDITCLIKVLQNSNFQSDNWLLYNPD